MTQKGRKWPVPKGPIPHGTLSGYSTYLCRCTECKAASAAYHRSRRNHASRKHGGRSTRIDVEKLRNVMDADPRTDNDIAIAAGYGGVSAISQMKRRGSGAFYGVDALACALGMHISEIMADPDELWRKEVTADDVSTL